MSSQKVGSQVRIDIDVEILRRKIIAISSEMSMQLRQTAQIPEINTERDYATGIVDRTGSVVATDNPLQLGALSNTARAVLNRFRFDMIQGDVVATNALEFGGTRAVDLSLISPFFVGNSAVLHFIMRARMPDLGGMIPGGFNPQASELFAEGVPFTPLKLYREGRQSRDTFTTLLLNSRCPEAMRLVLDAIIATINMGRLRIAELIANYGVESVQAALEYSQKYVERRTRAEIATWAEGTYYGEARLDHNGRGGEPVAVRVTARVKGDQLDLDFGASDAEVPSFINCTLSTTIGCVVAALLVRLGEDVPANEGLLRAVRVICEPGKLAGATARSPVGWSTVHCGGEIIEATARALRAAAPARHGDLTAPQILLFARPTNDRGSRLVLDCWGLGGASATAGLDGWGRPAVSSRSILPSVEEWELSKSVRIRSLEFAQNSAGDGEWRGAPAVEAVIETPKDHLYTVCWEGAKFGPEGVLGGGRGSPTVLMFETLAEGRAADTPRVAIELPLPGDILHLRGHGGAGYGNGKNRDSQAVLFDVLDGLITREAARSAYHVVLARDGRSVDSQATARLRAQSGE